eukprot:TRINITY_DN63032_c0_g1_i1.p1 TRINITY_DN63032_c0_g1~~TRINITY_DN63032_c0_g1_i1.p1  ORF type:complete len:334 (-),score=98.98 TRINITY_DN63032_c0_g1_i1:206-1207(-)
MLSRFAVGLGPLRSGGALVLPIFPSLPRLFSSVPEAGEKEDIASPPPQKISVLDILKKSGKRALGGGIPGAIAMVTQVFSLMWLRTTMNYTHKHGVSMHQAFENLYADGGIARFYSGAGPALLQGPLSRFGDTAANTGMLEMFKATRLNTKIPVFAQTACASLAAGTWRMFLTPVDTLKTMMQVHGSTKGMQMLKAKLHKSGVGCLYYGATASATATAVGHFPWFFVFNTLNAKLPKAKTVPGNLLRNAFMGFCGSLTSDLISNSIRVLKTVRQTHDVPITYVAAAQMVIAESGIQGLMFRGLSSKILANGIQSVMFTVMWRMMEAKFKKFFG